MQNAAQTTSALEVALAVWHRRKWLGLLAFAIPLAATAGMTRSLPDLYAAPATVLVEHQQVSDRLVGPSMADELETRLQTISQEILSRARLQQLIDRFGLYPDPKHQDTPESRVERMRRDIQLQFTAGRESTGRDTTIAFTISYRGQDPQTVAQVTNALAALYLERNESRREQQTASTVEFLQAQLDDLQQQLAAQERLVNEFKASHPGELPEQQAATLAALQRLNAQLSLDLDREQRLTHQREELVRQMTASSTGGASDDPMTQLARLRQQLADLRTRFTEEHPDVVRVKSQIAALERQLADAKVHQSSPVGSTDPVARQLQGELTRVETELRTLRDEEQALRRSIADYERRVENAPRRGQELQQISADYEALKERVQSVRRRYEDAQLAERAEQGQGGEQFRILDPAVPPTLPVAPNRFRLRLAGLLLSIALASGLVAPVDSRDTSFHTVDDLRAANSAPVIVTIPPIVTRADVWSRRWQFALASAATVVGAAIIAIAASHFARGNEALVRLLTPGRFF